jgi:hypothetical protein
MPHCAVNIHSHLISSFVVLSSIPFFLYTSPFVPAAGQEGPSTMDSIILCSFLLAAFKVCPAVVGNCPPVLEADVVDFHFPSSASSAHRSGTFSLAARPRSTSSRSLASYVNRGFSCMIDGGTDRSRGLRLQDYLGIAWLIAASVNAFVVRPSYIKCRQSGASAHRPVLAIPSTLPSIASRHPSCSTPHSILA